MATEINNTKSLLDVVTKDMVKKALQRGAEGLAEDVHEFIEHVHTLWNNIANLYDEYVIALVYLGIKVELKITDRDNHTVVESKLGATKKEDDDELCNSNS